MHNIDLEILDCACMNNNQSNWHNHHMAKVVNVAIEYLTSTSR